MIKIKSAIILFCFLFTLRLHIIVGMPLTTCANVYALDIHIQEQIALALGQNEIISNS